MNALNRCFSAGHISSKSLALKNLAGHRCFLSHIFAVQKVNMSSEESTNFGFQQVKVEEKQTKVNEVFTNVSDKYDIMNDAMSFGLHRVWKSKFIENLSPTQNTRLLDVASGTGDIAFRFLNYLENRPNLKISNQKNQSTGSFDRKKVTVCDINQDMLNVGKKRAQALGLDEHIDWHLANAENLVSLKDNSFDVYTISFGIRNCTNIDRVVQEAYRVLKPGGRFMCLEFSQVENELFRKIYDTYSFQMIPTMGYLIAGDYKSYQYLVESIRVFPNQEDFADLIKSCGFKKVSFQNMTNGIVALHSGFKL